MDVVITAVVCNLIKMDSITDFLLFFNDYILFAASVKMIVRNDYCKKFNNNRPNDVA